MQWRLRRLHAGDPVSSDDRGVGESLDGAARLGIEDKKTGPVDGIQHAAVKAEGEPRKSGRWEEAPDQM